MDIEWFTLFVAISSNFIRVCSCSCCKGETTQQKIEKLQKAIQELENDGTIKKHEQCLKDAHIYGLLISVTDYVNEMGFLRLRIAECKAKTAPGSSNPDERTQMHKKVESYEKQVQELVEQHGKNKTELIKLFGADVGMLPKYMKEVFNLQLLNESLQNLNEHLKKISPLRYQFNAIKESDGNKKVTDFNNLEKYLKYLDTATTIYERLEAGLKHREKVKKTEDDSLNQIKSNVSKVKSLNDLKTTLLNELRQHEQLHRIYPAMVMLRGLDVFEIKHLDTLKAEHFTNLSGIDVIKKVAEIFKLRRRNSTMKELQKMATEMGISAKQRGTTNETGGSDSQPSSPQPSGSE